MKKAGALAKPILSSLENSDSATTKSSSRPTSSETTSLASQGPGAERLIGLLRGETGSGELATIPPAYTDPIAEPVEERALRLINSERKLSVMSRSDLTRIAGGPDRRKKTALRVEALLSHYAEQAKSPSVIKLVVADWLEALEPYPFYAIEAACKVWLFGEKGKWRPQISDIVALAGQYGWTFMNIDRLSRPRQPPRAPEMSRWMKAERKKRGLGPDESLTEALKNDPAIKKLMAEQNQ